MDIYQRVAGGLPFYFGVVCRKLAQLHEATLAKWTEAYNTFSPAAIYANIRTACVKVLSEPFIDLVPNHAGNIPADTKTMFII